MKHNLLRLGNVVVEYVADVVMMFLLFLIEKLYTRMADLIDRYILASLLNHVSMQQLDMGMCSSLDDRPGYLFLQLARKRFVTLNVHEVRSVALITRDGNHR